MPTTVINIAMILLLLVSLLRLLSFLREKTALGPELSRKLAHILMGLVTLSFPWLFNAVWPVVLMAILAIILLSAIRFWPPLKNHLGQAILCSERFTLGEIFFPLGVLVAFLLSDSDKLLYVVSILTLTIADPIAAFVGLRFARSRRRPIPKKSIEGSVAFLLAASLTAFIALKSVAGMNISESLLISLNFGIILALIEAVSLWGSDNISVPVGAIILLKVLPYFSLSAQMVLLIAAILTIKVLLTLQRQKATVVKHS